MSFLNLIYSKVSGFRLALFLWILLTAININKAYHIDDTFHLEAAEWIKHHPLKPMSGVINWDNSPSPIFNFNQPPLFFYLIAATQAIFGDSELAMHLLLSIFTFLSLFFFNKVLLLLNVRHQNTLLLFFAFCPAFIINQNVMIDVPILSLTLGIAYYILKAQKEEVERNYLKAAILLSIGLMMKYSLLPLLVPLLLSILIFKKYKSLLALLIPILVLTLWAVWNLLEFNAVHFFNRPKSDFHINNLFAFMGTLGSMSTFVIIYIYALFPKRISKLAIFLSILVFMISIGLVYFNVISEKPYAIFIDYLFIGVGFVLILLISIYLAKLLRSEKFEYLKSDSFIILLFISGLSMFIILFAPFNATRHILLIVPFFLLFGHKLFEKVDKTIRYTTVILTVLLGVLLGVSDWISADFYRKAAKEIKITNNTVWSCGHWGWQWYSKKSGMKIYSKGDDIMVRTGDIMVYPKNVSKQVISNDLKLMPIDYYTSTPNFLTFFSGKNFASMYNSFFHKPAWTLSNQPIDTIVISKVEKEIGVSDIVNRIKSDESWLNAVKSKAIKSGIPLDSMLVLDAKWVINQKRN